MQGWPCLFNSSRYAAFSKQAYFPGIPDAGRTTTRRPCRWRAWRTRSRPPRAIGRRSRTTTATGRTTTDGAAASGRGGLPRRGSVNSSSFSPDGTLCAHTAVAKHRTLVCCASSLRTSGSVTAEYARSPYKTPHLAGASAPGWSTLTGGSEHVGPHVFFYSTTPRLFRRICSCLNPRRNTVTSRHVVHPPPYRRDALHVQ